MSKTINAVDLFCGAGGFSTALYNASQKMGYGLNLTAINHWKMAIETHKKNHPNARHLCQNINNLDPREVVPDKKLDILIASPECTHFSVARGGRPKSDQSRVTAWQVVNWASTLQIQHIIMENVKEFQDRKSVV